MSQHDFTIANQTASSARTDINNALKALASTNSGTGAPPTPYANQMWYETDTNRLKMRNEANTAWLDLGYIDQTDGLEILDNTKLVNTSGTQVGLLGDQSTATWQGGTGTTDSLVSPANIKAAILALQSTYTQPTTINSVGSYAFLVRVSGAVYGNSTYAGSGLLRAGVHAVSTSTTINQSIASNLSQLTRGDAYNSGTWRAMGSDTYQPTTTANRLTLFLRIS